MRVIPFNHEPGRLPPTLAKVPFLAQLTGSAMDGLLSRASVLEFFPGDVIIREGEQSAYFCILLKGSVRVVKGVEEVARIEENGALIGELAMLNGEARSASVEGLTHGFCLRVEPGFLERLSDQDRSAFYATLYRFVARLLGERLAECTAQLAAAEKELQNYRSAPVRL